MADPRSTIAVACPICGGDVQFDPALGKLVCEYCGSEITPEEAQARYDKEEEKLNEKPSSASSSQDDGWGEDSDDMRAFSCSSCGAEMIAEENTAAMICPFCGNSTIVPAQFDGAIRPDCLVPFAFTKDQAISKYKGYYSGKKLLPKSFDTSNHIEDIQGVYVPFWLYEGSASIDAHYRAYDRREHQNETEFIYFNVQRQGTLDFRNVPTDASERMPDDLMDSIEPYDFGKLADFNISYLPGFLAEKSNSEEKAELERAEKRIKGSVSSLTRQTVRHDSIKDSQENIRVDFGNRKYVLLPVWYLVTKWNDKTWTFAMNGQTGKFIGDLPIDTGKMVARLLIAFAVAALIVYLITQDITYTVFGGLIVSAIAGATGYASMKPVSRAADANNYVEDLKLSLATEQYDHTEHRKKQNS
ncbi:MAG: hypothetical protein J6I96_03145 [Oscillospiraceae bacterium]|nr:hypothetical protein [Oscillospiraceae bacterium]